MNDKVLIMMAVYNGENYISAQIDSILNQTYGNWKLVVQDDNSTDKTVDIVKEYASRDDRISVCSNETDQHGAYENFFALTARCKDMERFDYYMFSDQDDIWHEDKIERFLGFVKEREKKNRPILCYADMTTVDKEGKVIEPSLNKQFGMGNKNRTSFFFSHKVFGCNTMFNRALFEKVPAMDMTRPNLHILSHDNYFTKFAAVFGSVYFFPESLMDYRRHGDNSTSHEKYKADAGLILRRVTHLLELSELHANLYSQTLMAISEMKKLELNWQQERFVNAIEEALEKGGFRAAVFCIRHKVVWGRVIEKASRLIVLSLGQYRKYLVR